MIALEQAFAWAFERSMQASLLVLLILGIRLLPARWLVARWRHALWFPVLALLLLPALPESSFSVFNYVRHERLNFQADSQVFALPNPVRSSSSVVSDPELESFEMDAAPTPVLSFGWKTLVALSWMAVALVFLGVIVWTNWRFNLRIRSCSEPTDPKLHRLVDSCRQELGIRTRFRLVQMKNSDGPAITGILRPRLLVPAGFAEAFDDREIRLVMLHELGHWVRRDVLINGLLAILKAIYWFNPILWFAFRRIRADRELACDEWVLTQSRGEECVFYGETLLKLSVGCVPTGPVAEMVGIFEDRKELQRRVEWIAGFSMDARRWSLLGGTTAVLLAVTFLTRAVTTNVPLDPEMGKIVDRNGDLLAECRILPDSGLKIAKYLHGAFAAHLLNGLDASVLPKPGEVLYLTIDAKVQAAAEAALRAVPRGAAVVLDPSNGDILAMASVPSFDPNDFIPSIAAKKWKKLADDETAPLLNRALDAFTPGSTYTMVTALAGASAGLADRRFTCDGGVQVGSMYMKCWIFSEGGHGSLDLESALQHSCGAYFYQFAAATGIDELTAMGRRLGIGQRTGIPVRGENPGILDSPEYLRKNSPNETWREGFTMNDAIGQGSMMASPLQLAGVAATLANGGRTYVPRLIERVAGSLREPDPIVLRSDLLKDVLLRTDAVESVRHGLWKVVNEKGGTARKASSPNPAQSLSGKTGTAQSWRTGKNGEHIQDTNGLFAGFAPYKNPKYAICVLVQGAKAGGSSAAPLAKRIIDDVESGRAEISYLQAANGSFEPVVSLTTSE